MAETAVTESAQALFCAIADYLGVQETRKAFDYTIYPTYKDFVTKYEPPGRLTLAEVMKKSCKDYIEIDVNFQDVQKLLMRDERWYRSSINVAKAVVTKVDSLQQKFQKIKKFDWSTIYYTRGDKEIMGTIEKLFKIANDNLKNNRTKTLVPFGNINKWNPADIYLASEKAPKMLNTALSDANLDFVGLNILISDMMDSGDLLPLSLKISPDRADIHEVNFDRKHELEKIRKVRFVKFNKGEDGERYLDIKIKEDGSNIVIRHDPSNDSGGKFVVEIKLKNARGGSLTGYNLADRVELVDPTFSKDLERTITRAMNDFKEKKKLKMKGFSKTSKEDKKIYDEKLGQVSKQYASDPVFKLIINHLKRSPNADRIVQTWVAYAGSVTELSSKFVVAK